MNYQFRTDQSLGGFGRRGSLQARLATTESRRGRVEPAKLLFQPIIQIDAPEKSIARIERKSAKFLRPFLV